MRHQPLIKALQPLTGEQKGDSTTKTLQDSLHCLNLIIEVALEQRKAIFDQISGLKEVKL